MNTTALLVVVSLATLALPFVLLRCLLVQRRRKKVGAVAANEAASPEIFAVNEAAYGVDDGGVMVVPFGEVPVLVSVNGRKVRGLQRIDAEAGNAMAADMGGILGALKNAFMGRPIFLGHPYHPDPVEAAKYPDKRARGFIKSVEVANDGIRLMPKYNKLGNEEVTDQQMIFHSPQWRMQPVLAANGQQEVKDGMPVFRPYSLHSGGLTNNPNIPVPPLMGANDAPAISMDLNKLVSALKDAGIIQAGDDEAAIISALGNIARDLQWARDAKTREARELALLKEKVALDAANEEPTREALLQSLLSQVEAMAANAAEADTLKREQQTQIEAANEQAKASRTARVDDALAHLIRGGRVTGAQKDALRAELIEAANEEAVTQRLGELGTQKPRLGLNGGVTDELKGADAKKVIMAANDASQRKRLRDEAVNDVMAEITKGRAAKPGDKETAWNIAARRNPSLFSH